MYLKHFVTYVFEPKRPAINYGNDSQESKLNNKDWE